MIAVSVNVGGGVRLTIWAKLYMCTQSITHTEVMCLKCFVRNITGKKHKNTECKVNGYASKVENIGIKIFAFLLKL